MLKIITISQNNYLYNEDFQINEQKKVMKKL